MAEKAMKIYLAGPMSGIAHFNYPAFDAAAAMLRAFGHEVFNPAEHDRKMHGKDISNATGDVAQAAAEHGFDRRKALTADLNWIGEHADAIVLLPGWEKSGGARLEKHAAEEYRLKVIVLPATLEDVFKELRLAKAA